MKEDRPRIEWSRAVAAIALGTIFVASTALVVMTAIRIYSQYSAQKSASELSKAVATANSTPPTLDEQEVRLDRVANGPGPLISYHYTLVRYPKPGQSKYEIFRRTGTVETRLISNACTYPPTRALLDRDFAVMYVYSDRSDKKLFELAVHRAQCGP